jgi:branched-chain amino acid transport system permease protein
MTLTLALQLAIAGISVGSIYALVALAIVIPFKSSGVLNFGQGEIVTLGAYIALILTQLALPYPVVVASVLLLGAAGGVVIERVLIRPVENAPILSIVMVTLGLLVICNSVAGWIWTYVQKPFPSPFPSSPFKIDNIVFGAHDVGQIQVTLLVLLCIYLFFRFTPLGLAMRAAAHNPVSSRLVGIRVGWMLALGWGLAAVFGAVAGMMVAPVLTLEPNLMGGVQIYAFAAATLGGFTSPGGAVLGGFIVGVVENLVGTYVSFIGTELKFTVALAMIIVVLLVKPTGLFGSTVVKRV